MLLADTVSRMNPKLGTTIKPKETIHEVKWSDKNIGDLCNATEEDEELRPLKEVIRHGWPDRQQELSKSLRTYWSMKDFLSIENGILMKGDRIIVPKCMQMEILNRLHESHQGVEKTRLRARTCVYWRGIDKDIEDLIAKCDVCLKYSRCEQKQSMIPHDLPSGPWQKVGTDLFQLEGHVYLIVADYYSKMPFVRRITSKSCRCVIANLKTLFSEHGIPDNVFSDGGPCCSSSQFAKFAVLGIHPHNVISTLCPVKWIA